MLGWEECNFATAECFNSGNVDSFSTEHIKDKYFEIINVQIYVQLAIVCQLSI